MAYWNGRGIDPASPGYAAGLPHNYNVRNPNQGFSATGGVYGSPRAWQQPQHARGYPTFRSPASPYIPAPPPTQGRKGGTGSMAGRAEKAARIAYEEALSRGESISAWKITQALLLILQADSLDSLDLRPQDIPCLHKIILLEGKLNAFIHCYVAVRRIATLHDLSIEICRHEGIEDFERLGLGPLLRHPLIVHYFALPADAMAVFKVTTEKIISYLSDYMDGCDDKDIRAEEFLSFVAKKESVSSAQQLCVRVQSLRMHIGLIHRIKKVEKDLARHKEAETQKRIEIARKKDISDNQSQILTDRVNSFLSIEKAVSVLGQGPMLGQVPKHLRFETDSSSDDEEDDWDLTSEKAQFTSVKKRKVDYQCKKTSSNCPYPSALEEQARLGKCPGENFKTVCADGEVPVTDSSSDDEDDDGHMSSKGAQFTSPKKRKTDSQCKKSLGSSPSLSATEEHGQLLTQKFKSVCADEIVLTENGLKEFVAAWKDICREHSVFEVFKRMLSSFHPKNDAQRNKSKVVPKCTKREAKVFTKQPAIGLLNVAVMSMKIGLWDSLYDTFQEVNKFECTETKSGTVSGVIDVGPSSTKTLVSSNKKKSAASVTEKSVSIDEILRQLERFFEIDCNDNIKDTESAMNECSVTLRKVWDCEKWIVNRFALRDFTCLGFGDFLEFLEKYASRLPTKLSRILNLSTNKSSPPVAYIAEHQLLAFLFQAAWELGDDVMVTTEEIRVLLRRQFPLINFELSDSHSLEEVLGSIRKKKKCSQRNTMYSAALLARSDLSNCLLLKKSYSSGHEEQMFVSGQKIGIFGHMTSIDAVQCLLKAPMLSDLDEWSHWDLVFAPMLGPLLNWLEKEGNANGLVSLVTRNGNVIRLDGLATMDTFLAAAVKGSGLETAIQLVSVVSLYGGTHHAPVALMKSHASRAMEVLVKNAMDCFDHQDFMHSDKGGYCLNCQRGWPRDRIYHNDSDHALVSWKSHVSKETAQKENTDEIQHVERTTKAISVAARFILDCLICMPSEFRAFCAHILLPGLSSLSADASQIILRECISNQERFMLHEIGLSNGIVTWIEDYRLVFLEAPYADVLCISSKCRVGNDDVPSSTQSTMESEPGVDQLKGIDHSDEKLIEKKEESLSVSTVLQYESLNKKHSYYKLEESENNIPRHEKIVGDGFTQSFDNGNQEEDAKRVIEAIRCEEFGVDCNLNQNELNLLVKQHARLGRALHCLSQELYSQDSHFLLELVQNADDNLYPAHVEPTLAFILQSSGVVVLNNELGFTAQNIRALCDVGNSTKKGSSAGYIGQKGIGFKSVFRVTDTPEIHSNGFHVKFDITKGELGFVLPTLIPSCDISSFNKELCIESDKLGCSVWNTCIVLPFKSSILKGTGMKSLVSKFADLHPSLLLFLHRLRCIKIRNSMMKSCDIMRREDIGNGLVKVSYGKKCTTWLVASKKLNKGIARPGVETTEIALAFTLQDNPSGDYGRHLEQQPVFSFLPLRTYGLKFILQGDFILPSSREEVDTDSVWNQWLLSEYPDLFVSAAKSFQALPCFQSNPGKAITLFMSFVPLEGEVLGFFSPLPRMILSRLRASPCLPLEGKDRQWVLPCMVLRGWNDHIRCLLPDELLNDHLGLGYLHRDVNLPDPLATNLGVQTYGAGTLIEIMKSICNRRDGLKTMGLEWLGSWFVALHDCLNFQQTTSQYTVHVKPDLDCLGALHQIQFIPLSDGSYASPMEGPLWLPCEATEAGLDGAHILKSFPNLYHELKTVNPSLFLSADAGNVVTRGDSDLIVRMLRRFGVGRLSAHDVVMTYILQAMADDECMAKDKLLVTEYLAFIMMHLQSGCSACYTERGNIILQLKSKAVIATNNGYKRVGLETLHFSREFGNPIDMRKILAGTNVIWNEIDNVYLQFSCNQAQSLNLSQWRMFFSELGVTDFVQLCNIKKKVEDQSCSVWKDMPWDSNPNSVGWIVKDWESPELMDILSTLSSSKEYSDQCSYLLEALDKAWDELYGTKNATYWCSYLGEKEGKPTETSCVLQIRQFQWVKSTLDGNLHFPTDLFFDCDDVKSILGYFAPYATPQVQSRKFVADIGFKKQVPVEDALNLLEEWSKSQFFKASTSQMGRLYSFLWSKMSTSKEEILGHFRMRSSIFVPLVDNSNEEVLPGVFLSVDQVFWIDPTGCLDLVKRHMGSSAEATLTDWAYFRSLCQIYPNLHNFFVNECCVRENPDFDGYIRILQNLSSFAPPSQVSKEFMQVLFKWAEDVDSGRVNCKEISRWKDCLHELEVSVFPTMQEKWVSLHPNSGFVCWCDDSELGKQFKHCNGVYFLHLDPSDDLKSMKANASIPSNLINLMHALGIPSLSQVVVREAIFYGVQDGKQMLSLINWILPYAQRYLGRMHPEVYCALKDSKFDSYLQQLRLLVVEELFYRHTLQGFHTDSNKRYKCNCLLQGSTLYVSQTANFSALYMELSRLFFNGSVNIQLANFLHLITVMAESGSTEGQTESFIMDAQTIPKLPSEEPIWFIEYREDTIDTCTMPSNSSITKNNSKTKKRSKFCVDDNWPPTTWIDAPRSQEKRNHVSKEDVRAAISTVNQDAPDRYPSNTVEDIPSTLSPDNDGCDSNWIVDDVSASTLGAFPRNAEAGGDKPKKKIKLNGESATATENDIILGVALPGSEDGNVSIHSQELSGTREQDDIETPSVFNNSDQLCVGVPNDERRQQTGRLGEQIAYKYLVKKYGPTCVEWVNEKEESGMAFDIIVSREDGKKEFIEVKATRSEAKDWFEITNKEWDFASKNSDCFTIIRVFLTSKQIAKFVSLSNPIKLCQEKIIKLAILMPTYQHDNLPAVTFMPSAAGED